MVFSWKEAFCSQSYCLLTTGGVTIDVIRRYIETQMLAELLTYLEECSDAEYLELLSSISIDQEEFDVEQA